MLKRPPAASDPWPGAQAARVGCARARAGYIGWEECANLWVRGKQPFERKGGMECEPKKFFDLLDFVTLDVKLHGHVTGRVPSTEMLELFRCSPWTECMSSTDCDGSTTSRAHVTVCV